MGTSTNFDFGHVRQMRAIETYKPSDYKTQALSKCAEAWVAKNLGATRLGPRAPLDAILCGVGIEVKALVDNPRGNITIHPEAKEKKLALAKELSLESLALVVLDFRDGKDFPDLYFRKNIGSYNIKTLTRVHSWKDLKRGLLDEAVRTDRKPKATRPGTFQRSEDFGRES